MKDEKIRRYKEEHNKLIESFGGYSAARRRVAIQRIYAMLYFRLKRGVETLEFDSGVRFSQLGLSPDIFTETGISKLRIPAFSCFDYKERIISDSVYRVNEFAVNHIQKHPGAKVYLLYQEKGELSERIILDAKKHKKVEIYQVDEFLKKIDKVAKINDAIEESERDWKKMREMILDSAQASFREDKCTFFLGAGVSMDAGGPSWENLLRKIMSHFKRISKKKDFNKIYSWCGTSPIILGRYAASNEKILQYVSEYLQHYVLYKGVNTDDSELIKAICEAVEGPQKVDRIVASGFVDSIITYNYDDLVETALEERGNAVARIYYKSRNRRSEFPVYHVHGLIPKKNNGIASTPILGEKEYHQMYKEAYHWSNVEQLHALDRNTCFFIGLSMTDPNLRRLLDISQTGSDKDYHHFAFLQRKALFPLEEIEKNKNHYNTIEFQLADLGVQVIWYEDHTEVPSMIRRIISPMQYVG